MASLGVHRSSSSGNLSATSAAHHPAVSRLRPSNIPRAASHSNLCACAGEHHHQHLVGAFVAPRPQTENGTVGPKLARGLPPLSALGSHHQHLASGREGVRFVTSSSGQEGASALLAAAAQDVAAHPAFNSAQAGSSAAQQQHNAHRTKQQQVQQVQQQQHEEASAAAASAARTTTGAAPFASLTRVFLIGAQPSNLVRQLASRKWRVAGPVSLLLFLFGLVLAILTAVRTVLVRRVRACQCCKGYGIVRCRLCNGEGTVAWMGKNNHQEMCPLCMTKRFVTCPDCGGYHHKKMFTHIQATPSRGLVPEFLGAA